MYSDILGVRQITLVEGFVFEIFNVPRALMAILIGTLDLYTFETKNSFAYYS